VRTLRSIAIAGVLACAPAIAAAQARPPGATSPNQIAQPHEPAVDDDANLETATPDPTPPARPVDPESATLAVVEQAGVGGPVPYGAAGVLEVGGAGLVWADDASVWANLRPFAGLFVADAIQLTLANDLVFTWSEGQDLAVALAYTIEPSLHLGLVDRLWLAVGIGGGLAYDGVRAAALGNARLGLDVLVGRSGMLHLHGVGMLASEPLASPASTDVGTTQWRVGFEIAYAALF